MLLAVKTVKSDWCVSIRLLLVKKSVGLLLVKCILFVCFVVVVNKSFVCNNLRTYDMTPGFKPFTIK